LGRVRIGTRMTRIFADEDGFIKINIKWKALIGAFFGVN